MLIHTTGLTETATTGNLLPNAGTGQTSVQHNNSTIDGINNSNNWTLNNVTDYSSSYNELEANGTGTVSADGSLLNISAGDHTTTVDSLDGGVTLSSKTEVQNCEWTGSAHRCGQATSGRDSYSTTVTILDENDTELATVTQNRNNDSGYNNNTFTYTDTVTHTGEGARKWEWQWQGIDGDNPNSTSPLGPNLLGAELKATLLNILYSPLPPAIKTEIEDVFEDIGNEFEEIQQIVEEFLFEEKIEVKEEITMEEPIMLVMEIKEEEKFEETPMFEEPIMIMQEEKEEEEPVMEMVQLFTEEKEEKEDLDNSMEEGIIEVSEKESEEEEKNEQPEEVKENESNGETTKTANASKKSNTKQKNIQSKENKTVSHTDILNKIDENIKDVSKNLQLKNLVTLKAMSDTEIILSSYNVPFYKPKDIYLDQLDMYDNREIYSNINLNSYIQQDPIATKINKINELKIERQQLLIQLEVLNNG
tara:strand:- start:451 stop:1881 length:1431 start_codon:yes stop_codon:yes gene_type:complete